MQKTARSTRNTLVVSLALAVALVSVSGLSGTAQEAQLINITPPPLSAFGSFMQLLQYVTSGILPSAPPKTVPLHPATGISPVLPTTPKRTPLTITKGYTPQPPKGSCGDGFCDAAINETPTSCPNDCIKTTPPINVKCGNGTCNEGETFANCPADCPAGTTIFPSVTLPTDMACVQQAVAGSTYCQSCEQAVAQCAGVNVADLQKECSGLCGSNPLPTPANGKCGNGTCNDGKCYQCPGENSNASASGTPGAPSRSPTPSEPPSTNGKCGNGTCNSTPDPSTGYVETAASCPADCGTTPPSTCGDGFCQAEGTSYVAPSTSWTPVTAAIAGTETPDNCPADCGTP